MAIATEICQPEWPSHGQAPGKKMASGIRRDIYRRMRRLVIMTLLRAILDENKLRKPHGH